jgi:hypothetical protein
MPIRFRCVYCDQLLGIARRKSGTVVKCPNCAGQLIVPSPEPNDDDAGPDAPTASTEDVGGSRHPAATATAAEKTAPAPAVEAQTAAGNAGMLFERSDFDELLKPAIERRSAPAAKTIPAGPQRRAAAPAPAVSPAPAAAFDFSQPAPASAPAPSLHRPAQSGLVLTPLKLVLLALLVLFGLGLAFAGGILLGWMLAAK